MQLRRLASSVILGSMTLLVASPSLATVAAEARALATPVVGECHDVSFGEASGASDASSPVDCLAKHTLMTISVSTVPESVWDKGRRKRIAYGNRVCRDANYAYFAVSRRTLAITVYQTAFFFFPTAEEVAAGQRFVRCDVARRAGSKLFPLAADPRFVEVTKHEARCMTARFAFAPCSRRHRFYPRSTVTLPRPRPAAGRETAVVERRCRRATGHQAPAVSWPAGDWSDNNIGVCYRVD